MVRRLLLALLTVGGALAALAVPAIGAGAPIMPLSAVTAGMDCTATTVVSGTALSTFNVHVIDVVTGVDATDNAFILFRASGPAVDDTGIAAGMSGSPVWCPGPGGVPQIAGAVSLGIGEYGNEVALATPIQAVLNTPVDHPAGARRMPALRRLVRPLATPLTVSGLSPAVGALLHSAAAAAHRTLIAAPAAPRTAFPVQTLQPGSSVSAMYSSGDIGYGAVGTVSYTDGDKVWAFGHPLDGAGARSLILGDAYVYTVISNPIGSGESSSYKLASPGHPLGTLTSDGPMGIAGRLGAGPPQVPVRVEARDADRGTAVQLSASVADERALGLPGGASALALILPAVAAEASYRVLQGNPAAQAGSMCLTIRFAARKEPLKLCNRYVGAVGGQSGLGGSPILADIGNAAAALDAYQFGPPRIDEVRVSMTLRGGAHHAYMTGLRGPSTVRRGRTARFRLTYHDVRGGFHRRTVAVPVPRGMPSGAHDLVLDGTPADVNAGTSPSDLAGTFNLDLSGGQGDAADDPGPRNLNELAAQIVALHRADDVTARFVAPGAGLGSRPRTSAEAIALRPRRVLRNTTDRLSGRVRVTVRVR